MGRTISTGRVHYIHIVARWKVGAKANPVQVRSDPQRVVFELASLPVTFFSMAVIDEHNVPKFKPH